MTMSTEGTNFVMYGAVIVTLLFDWLKSSSLILGPIFYIYLKILRMKFIVLLRKYIFVYNSGRRLLKVPLYICIRILYREPFVSLYRTNFSEYANLKQCIQHCPCMPCLTINNAQQNFENTLSSHIAGLTAFLHIIKVAISVYRYIFFLCLKIMLILIIIFILLITSTY